MADEAFALSPISARPTPPSESDYEAIRAAFVETSRGRWFLDEYARRNRNADTTMVLDAVARMEQTIAAKPPSAAGLAEAIGSIKAFVVAARNDASDSLAAIGQSAELATACKSSRVIREIAWSLRECGTDTRICDILDAQLRGVDALHELAGSSRQADLIGDIFDALLTRIDGLADSEQHVAGDVRAPSATTDPHARRDLAPSIMFDGAPESIDRSPDDGRLDEAAQADMSYPEDDDVLDLIALEMGAPQDDLFEDDELLVADDPIVQMKDITPQTVASSATSLSSPPATAPLQSAAQPNPSRQPHPAQPSLGEALLASGVVRAPMSSGHDPLAAIKRLSQVEKIALFS